MRAIKRYQAVDDSEWETAEEAEARDRMVADVTDALSELKPTPDECNWNGYVQQDPDAIQRCREKLHAIANAEGVLKWWIDDQKQSWGKTDADIIALHPTWQGRMLDGGHVPLSRAYSRLCAIDEEGREWNQPYYAVNPEKGENICAG